MDGDAKPYRERLKVKAEFEAAAPQTKVVTLQPAVPSRHEGQFARLQEALARTVRAGDAECAETM